MEVTGHTFSVRRMQTHDGPGLRTTVFMKGCPLRCMWCHNPESLTSRQEIWWEADRCIGCKTCVANCPEQAIEARPDGIRINRTACTACGACVDHCPAKALTRIRSDWTVDALCREIERDRAFIEEGGVTVSGGEPALQSDFVSALLQRCKESGLHTALDTCGAVRWEALLKILPHCDLVLFDLKLIDPALHQKWTSQDNQRSLENARRLAGMIRSDSRPELWLRTPLIPGATATKENISAIADFIRTEMPGTVSRWELCTFNNLCGDKYHRLNMPWEYEQVSLMAKSEAEMFHCIARERSGLPSERIFLKGRTGEDSPCEPAVPLKRCDFEGLP